MEGCGGEEQTEKERERKKHGLGKNGWEKSYGKKSVCGFETFTQSLTHFTIPIDSKNHFNHSSPNSPQNTSPSLWINTQTHPSLTHIYHTNHQPSISSTSITSLSLSLHYHFPNHTLNLPLSHCE
jgi:hypothetical protein